MAVDLLDVLTPAEAKRVVHLSESRPGHEEDLELWVTAVSRRIDDMCGPVVIREVTETVSTGGGLLFPTYTPVASITSITEYVSGTGTVLTAEDHDTSGTYLLRDDVIARRSGWSTVAFQGDVRIVYNAGRYASTAVVDAKFKMAAGAILRRLWARESAAWSRGGDVFAGEPGIGFFQAVEPMVREFLGDELRMPAVA